MSRLACDCILTDALPTVILVGVVLAPSPPTVTTVIGIHYSILIIRFTVSKCILSCILSPYLEYLCPMIRGFILTIQSVIM